MEINQILFLIGYWVIYFFLHSLLSALWMKEKAFDVMPGLKPYYRIIYNTISTVGLIYILFYLAVTPAEFLFEKNDSAQFIGLVLATWGLIILKLSFKQYSIKEFLGMQYLETSPETEFAAQGILSKIRHPIYSGTILIVSGFFLFNPKVSMGITLICVVVYIIIGIQLEERKLIKEFGQLYIEYRKRVPMLIPHLKSVKF